MSPVERDGQLSWNGSSRGLAFSRVYDLSSRTCQRIDLVIGFKKDYGTVDTEVDNTVTPHIFQKGNSLLSYGPSLNQNSQINVVALHDQGFDGSGRREVGYGRRDRG